MPGRWPCPPGGKRQRRFGGVVNCSRSSRSGPRRRCAPGLPGCSRPTGGRSSTIWPSSRACGPLRSWWPTMAEPSVLLVHALQVVSVCGAKAVPSAREPVRMSCSLGVSPRPLITLPRSSSADSLLRLLPLCRWATSRAMSTPLALYQGPLPMRSRALTAGTRRVAARRRRSGHAQVGPPGTAATARCGGQALALRVGTSQTAEVGALAASSAGDEEAHGPTGGRRRAGGAGGEQCECTRWRWQGRRAFS